jgi:single-stranded DNA-binding protein
MAPYLVKGQLISISGHLEQDKWESNGVNHSRMSLGIDDLRLLGPSAKKKGNADSMEMGVKNPDLEQEIGIEEDQVDPDFDMNNFSEEM